MKLRTKIFISILIVTLTTLFISSYYLINRSHLDNIEREQERSVNEFDFILASLDNSIDFNIASDGTLKMLISRFAQYYADRGINLMVYRNNSPLYKDNGAISLPGNSPLLNNEKHIKQAQVINENGSYYFLVSGKPTFANNFTIICIRDISEIYQSRTRNIYLSVLLVFILFILLGFLSFFYSHWITKPIDRLQSGAAAISQGEYSYRIPITLDEFNDLGTAFNQMAAAVQSRTCELEERANELQVFIDNLSHEMNTPLTSIQGYSEFLHNANASEELKQKAAANIKQEAKRLKDIYEKLMQLTISRVQEPDLHEVNITELFNELCASFHPQFVQYNAVFSVKNELHSIKMDRSFIYILLSNLVRNSLHALSGSGGVITLSAYLSDNKPVLEVSDNGFGIPKDKIDDIIKPFYRIDKSRSRKTGGAGLGLSICNNIAVLHKAALVIESEEGKGTFARIVFQELS